MKGILVVIDGIADLPVKQLEDNIRLVGEPALDELAVKQIQKVLHPLAKKEVVNPALWSVR